MTIDAVNRGIPVRLIHEPDEYRNAARQWDSWNVDRMYMAGVQIKMRKHLGLNHQKSVLLYGQGMTIFGSSNWTGPSSKFQQEHNYFTTKPWFFNWFVNQFERKWNSTTENEPFVPLPPNAPSYAGSGKRRRSPSRQHAELQWEGGRGRTSTTSISARRRIRRCCVADVSTVQSGAQDRSATCSTPAPLTMAITESYTIPITLQRGHDLLLANRRQDDGERDRHWSNLEFHDRRY